MAQSATTHIEFVTGKLAETALREVLATSWEGEPGRYTVTVLPITVAALMTPAWIARHWRPAPNVERVLLPGYCEGDLGELEALAQVPVQRGPRDLRRLPDFLCGRDNSTADLNSFAIEILAEINHAPRRSLPEIVVEAQRYAAAGADVIDVGCDPDGGWPGVGDCVRAVRDLGLRVSIDSLDPIEIAAATRAGAELVLSVNASNRDAAPDWGVEVVVIPDVIGTLQGMEATLEWLAQRGIPFRLDPILEPIGCGFARSLERYLEVRRRWPAARMMMGIGNLTELTEVDSAGVNFLLLGFCAELQIHSVLTTEVISWARSSVRECALGRRLVHFAVRHGIPPKHLDPGLVMLRDPQLESYSAEQLEQFASKIRDHNYRVFAERGEVHLLFAGTHLQGVDPFLVFHQLLATAPKNLDASHAFYLGYEMAKAVTAITLGKNYRQDEALEWGQLTVPETRHRLSSVPISGVPNSRFSADRPTETADRSQNPTAGQE